MLSIGFLEILVIAVLGLLVFGPEKLPEAIRTFAFGISKVKRSWNNTRRELEQELGMDEIRREIHNAQVMEDLERLKAKTQSAAEDFNKSIEESEALSEDASTSHIKKEPDQPPSGEAESESESSQDEDAKEK